MTSNLEFINISDAHYLARLRGRLGADAPARLTILGDPELVVLPMTALFCSAPCPGYKLLAAQAVAFGTPLESVEIGRAPPGSAD